jgi:hypothetical protein
MFHTGMEEKAMPLSKAQQNKIDELIGNNKKELDIIQELVANHVADAREVSAYVKSNNTLQGMLKAITHRTKDIASAGDQASREAAAKEVERLSKKAIKILQQEAAE